MSEKKEYSKEEIEELAGKVTTLLTFCAQLIPDIDKLEEVYKSSFERADMAMSASPILMASGIDPDEKQQTHLLYAKRAKALHNLVKVLIETEEERIAQDNARKAKAEGAKILDKLF